MTLLDPPQLSTTLHTGAHGEVGPLYTRLLTASSGAIFLTYELYRDVSAFGPAFPIWRSTDCGATWRQIASVEDTTLRLGNRYQPSLYELPRPFAHLPAGALLLAGNAIPSDMSSTTLVVYSSTDGGHSWNFESIVDAGGPAVYDPSADSTTDAVWEPCLDLVDDTLVCYFADERHKANGMLQVLAHRTTDDLRAWSHLVVDFEAADYYRRPGMFVSTGQMHDGMYRGVFEIVGPRTTPIYLAISKDGLDWGGAQDLGKLLVAKDGTTLSGTPNISWCNDDGAVTVIVTGRLSLDARGYEGNRGLVNFNGGVGEWHSFELPTPAERRLLDDSSGYSQSVVWAPDGNLVHATTVRNAAGSHDVVVTVAPAPATWPR